MSHACHLLLLLSLLLFMSITLLTFNPIVVTFFVSGAFGIVSVIFPAPSNSAIKFSPCPFGFA